MTATSNAPLTLSKALNDDLLESSHLLTEEHPDLPAGAVLRCYARAVRRARAWGCPPEHLRVTAEASTRWMLAQRAGAAALDAETRVAV